MNDTSSFFIEQKALFGSYPTQDIVNDFINKGVTYFIDLTNNHEKEKLLKYNVSKECKYINYQIRDRSIPENLYEFSKFIIKISDIICHLKNNEKIYIHCRGGHGRAGLVVCCLLCYIYKYNSTEGLHLTNQYHNNRKVMNDKWRQIGSPQTENQKKFIVRMFKPIFLNNIYNKNTYYFLNNHSKHCVMYKNHSYDNINFCYYSNKFPSLKKKLLSCTTYYQFKNLITSSNEINNTTFNKTELIMILLKDKFTRHKCIHNILVKTFLRPIHYIHDEIQIGNIWENIRHDYLMELYVSCNNK